MDFKHQKPRRSVFVTKNWIEEINKITYRRFLPKNPPELPLWWNWKNYWRWNNFATHEVLLYGGGEVSLPAVSTPLVAKAWAASLECSAKTGEEGSWEDFVESINNPLQDISLKIDDYPLQRNVDPIKNTKSSSKEPEQVWHGLGGPLTEILESKEATNSMIKVSKQKSKETTKGLCEHSELMIKEHKVETRDTSKTSNKIKIPTDIITIDQESEDWNMMVEKAVRLPKEDTITMIKTPTKLGTKINIGSQKRAEKIDKKRLTKTNTDNEYRISKNTEGAFLETMHQLQSATNRNETPVGRADSDKKRRHLAKLIGVKLDSSTGNTNPYEYKCETEQEGRVKSARDSPSASGARKKEVFTKKRNKNSTINHPNKTQKIQQMFDLLHVDELSLAKYGLFCFGCGAGDSRISKFPYHKKWDCDYPFHRGQPHICIPDNNDHPGVRLMHSAENCPLYFKEETML